MRFAQYYRAAFQVVQEVTTNSEDMSSVLLKILDLAQSRYFDGITAREAYRRLKILETKAKNADMKVAEYTVGLFRKLEELGKGQPLRGSQKSKVKYQKSGIAIDLLSKVSTPPTKVESPRDAVQENENPVTVVTVAENLTKQGKELSPVIVTVPVTGHSIENSTTLIETNPVEGNNTEDVTPYIPDTEQSQNESTQSPPFKVGDRVSSNDRKSDSFNWVGTIVKFAPGNPAVCYVNYPERSAKGLKPVISARVENLRHAPKNQ
ncbi:MAG: hypothetical protein SAK29_31885 [Scytonema sp. PMC 1069.18]|nr:hypothetical protein [Scytonema sp. PMC 1069.18]MEC4884349.1 hypothetical protein [Scytonema sp. PMC 1070.18]